MKIVLAILIVLLLAGAGGAYYYLSIPKSDDAYMTTSTSETTKEDMSGDVTLTGILRKSEGDDYHYVIVAEGRSTGVASQSVQLDQYEDKTVTVTGQYSGTTLYADSVTEQ